MGITMKAKVVPFYAGWLLSDESHISHISLQETKSIYMIKGMMDIVRRLP